MIRISNEESAMLLAGSYRRDMQELGRIPELAAWFHIPMQEIRIGFREHDANSNMSLETLNLELNGGRS